MWENDETKLSCGCQGWGQQGRGEARMAMEFSRYLMLSMQIFTVVQNHQLLQTTKLLHGTEEPAGPRVIKIEIKTHTDQYMVMDVSTRRGNPSTMSMDSESSQCTFLFSKFLF